MRFSRALFLLCMAVAVLALVASGIGLFWSGGSGPVSFTTFRGQTAMTYGKGVYSNDSLLVGAGLRGTDAITLFLCVPLLVVSTFLYRSSSFRSRFLLAGVLSYFVYNSASLALGAAYNPLFLLYVAYFSTSFFAFVSACASVDLAGLQARVAPQLPRRGIAAFLFVSGSVLALVWLSDLVGALAAGALPATLPGYTTMMTYVLDLGIIAPAVFLSAVLVLRGSPRGYLSAFVLLALESLIGFVVAAQTVAQLKAGVSLTPARLALFAASFVVLSGFAIWCAAALLRGLPRAAE
jgi:hypothetical protein